MDTPAYVPIDVSDDDGPKDDGDDTQLDTETVWAAYLEGYKKGYSVESFEKNPIHRKTARSLFERWWERNK